MPQLDGGAWCIPDIAAEIPATLALKGAGVPNEVLAAFGLTGASLGVPIPAGTFSDAPSTVERQWNEFIAREVGDADLLGATLVVRTHQQELQVMLEVCDQLQGFRLKREIESLEKALPGLGWLVMEAVLSISNQGFPVYDSIRLAWMAEYMWWRGCTSDEGVAEELLNEVEYADDEKPTIDGLKKEFGFPWPSDLSAAYDGHRWMLGYGRRPKRATRTAARAFVSNSGASAHLRSLVDAALQVLKETGKRDHVLDRSAGPMPQVQHTFPYDDEGEPIGATCYVVWDDPRIMWEAIEHFENDLMQSSNSTPVHMIFRAELGSDDQMTHLAKQTKALVRRYALASRLLNHFEEAS